MREAPVIAFLIFDGLTPLDFVGPFEVLSRLPGARTRIVSPTGAAISASGGKLTIGVDCGIADVAHADVLVVPGGPGARTLMHDADTTAWVRTIAATADWTASVCTGSLILGGAGLLNGLDAATHWSARELLATTGAVPVAKRIVENPGVITAAGISAGIDMALLLAARIAGEDIAKAIQLRIEYDPQPPFDSGSLEKASAETHSLAASV